MTKKMSSLVTTGSQRTLEAKIYGYDIKRTRSYGKERFVAFLGIVRFGVRKILLPLFATSKLFAFPLLVCFTINAFFDAKSKNER